MYGPRWRLDCSSLVPGRRIQLGFRLSLGARRLQQVYFCDRVPVSCSAGLPSPHHMQGAVCVNGLQVAWLQRHLLSWSLRVPACFYKLNRFDRLLVRQGLVGDAIQAVTCNRVSVTSEAASGALNAYGHPHAVHCRMLSSPR